MASPWYTSSIDGVQNDFGNCLPFEIDGNGGNDVWRKTKVYD